MTWGEIKSFVDLLLFVEENFEIGRIGVSS